MSEKRMGFNFINDVPLNLKFLMIYVLCVLVPILMINLVFWNRISNDIKEREKANLVISINRVQTDISSILEGCVDISHSVSSDKELNDIMETRFNDDAEYYEVYNSSLRDRINRYLPIYNNVSDITVFTSNNTIDNGGSYYYSADFITSSSWYKEAAKANNKVILYPYRAKSYYSANSYEQHLSVLRQLDDFSTSSDSYNQVLKIDVDINKIYDIFSRERDYLDIFLLDPEGHIIFSTDHKYEGDLSKAYTRFAAIDSVKEKDTKFIRNLGNAKYLNGWKVVGISNHNSIYNESRESNIFLGCIIFVVTLLSSLLVWIIVRSYDYRLKKLLKHIKGVENQKFELIEIVEGKDEIGELIKSFNMMTSKINTLINDVYKLEIKKKDLEIQRVQAELKLLQSQVDPHFLFNTLNAVMAICVKNNYTDLTDVIKYLSKIFRRLISWKDDLVTVREEISFTEMYLKIEKFRFLDKFDYQIEVEESTLDLKVPKMSIQTLVENACKHGIQNTTGVGIAKIRVKQNGEFLCVEVEDNGSGIEADKLKRIIESLSEEDDFCENVGIRNVYKRLYLYYGDEVEFNIQSELDKGTIIRYGININMLNTECYSNGRNN